MTNQGNTFEVTASANTLNPTNTTYQWKIFIPSANMWVAITGQTSQTITINHGMVSGKQDSEGYAHIQCVATDGTTTVTSDELKIKVYLK